jgi:hypothetical protein
MQIRLLEALHESPGYMNSMKRFKPSTSPATSGRFGMSLRPSLEIFSDVECRVTFESRPSIFVPATGAREAAWAVPRQCLWEAPPDMESRYPLKSLYKSYFNQDNGNGANLTAFFEKTLLIPNVSTEDFLVELKTLKSTKCTDFDRINRIYESIDRMRTTITSTAINSLK